MLSKAICAQSINLDTQCYLPLICGIIFDCPVKVLSDFSNVQLLFFLLLLSDYVNILFLINICILNLTPINDFCPNQSLL